MARAAVSMRPSAHSPLDNVSTKYNPIRLLKGAPPGQVIIENENLCISNQLHYDPLMMSQKEAPMGVVLPRKVAEMV